MRVLLICILTAIFVGVSSLKAQDIELSFQLVDHESKTFVSNAHVFINNGSKATVSDAEGRCQLRLSSLENQALVISHVSYETKIIPSSNFDDILNGSLLYMEPRKVELETIEFSAKRAPKWKKQYKLFRKHFIGQEDFASKCEILNPEVLRFEEENGELRVKAVDILQIDQKYLSYNIQFWLEECIIEANGSSYYKGYGHFSEKENTQKKHHKRREQIFQQSLAYFLQALISSPDLGALRKKGFEVAIEKYQLGQFYAIGKPTIHELVQADGLLEVYRLYFPEFLSITHTNLKQASNQNYQVSISKAEQQKFGSDASLSVQGGDRKVRSRLYKLEPYLLFDHRGVILNKQAVKEYDFWGQKRLASTLPIDYVSPLTENLALHVPSELDTLQIFKDLVGRNTLKKDIALGQLQKHWDLSYVPILLDIIHLSDDQDMIRHIKKTIRQHLPDMPLNFYEGSQWLWKKESMYSHLYYDFKGYIYSALDPKFRQYFEHRADQSLIRLDEVLWGGVRQDGIPPLRNPTMIQANDASYLSDSDIVFGMTIGNQAFAYPQRILAWHEFFTDTINGQSIAGVYCTLCGTVIIYNTEHDGVRHQLGTSGFLYRSNKLMYDQASQSLWSTIEGKPVIGPLVNQGIELSIIPVESTTWGTWVKRHPKTKVLSIKTGFDRNYNEGEAYKAYYATDELMFPVPKQDQRLANKAPVFIVRTQHLERDPLAISVDYLQEHPLHVDQVLDQKILILTEAMGSSRAYLVDSSTWSSYKAGILTDAKNQTWKVSDQEIIGPDGQSFPRLPAHEIFWFAWVNVYPNTRLVH